MEGPDSPEKVLTELLKKQHAAGGRYEWNVTESDVHISGDAAWITYGG